MARAEGTFLGAQILRRTSWEQHAQRTSPRGNHQIGGTIPKFLIEREIPDAGKLSAEQLQGISQKSCSVLRSLGPSVQWVHSYVTDDKIYCVYIAENEGDVRKHAAQGGFPANRISEIRTTIDPTTAEARRA